LLLLWCRQAGKFSKPLGIACAVFLAVLPFWRIGAFNDLMMRASLPAFVMLSLLLLQAVGEQSRKWQKVALAMLILGSGGLAFDVTRHIEFKRGPASQTDFTSPAKVPPMPLAPDLTGLLDQYLGTQEAPFVRIFARPLPRVNDPITYNKEAPPAGVMEKQNQIQRDLRDRFERGERSMEFLQQYGTVSYIQGEMWESVLAFETMVKLYPDDPNARLKLASLLATSSIKAYHDRALVEFEVARQLAGDSAEFNQFTEDFQKLLNRLGENSD